MTCPAKVTLADVCESVRYGYTASATDEPVGPRFLRITDIVPESLNWESVPYCAIDDEDRERFALRPADIVVARTGATVGYAKLIRDQVDAVFASYLVRFRVDEQKAHPGYVGRLIESPIYKAFVQSQVGGAAQPNANAQVLGTFKFSLPARPHQEKAVSTLSAYEDLVENNLRRMALLEEAARLLYQEWFVRLRFPGHEHTAKANGIPEGWTRKPLASVCETVDYGYTASAQQDEVGPKFLRITDIVPDTIDWSAVPHCPIEQDRFEKFQLHEGDIVIARTGATVGYAKRLHKRHPDAVFASYLVRLRLKPEVDNLMVGIFVESAEYKAYVQSRVGGAAQPNANAKVLAAAEMLFPPAHIQRDFKELVQPLFDQRELLQIQNQKLRAARDMLLPRLMSGEITV